MTDTQPVPTTSGRRIEHRALADLPGHPGNPKAHDLNLINASVGRFGYIEPVVLDERTGQIISGHGRTETLKAMEAAGQQPPDGITIDPDTGRWLAPVVVGWGSRSDAEANAAVIALNRTTEVGGWVDESLLELLDGLADIDGGLDGVGYGEDDIADLRARLAELDDSPQPGAGGPSRPLRQPAEGPGRVTLYHGDNLDIMRQLPEASMDAVVCDPPYGLEFMGKDWDSPWKRSGDVLTDPAEVGGFQDGTGGNPYSRSRIRIGDSDMAGFQEWCREWATACLRLLKPGGHLIAFGATRTHHRLMVGIEDAGFQIRDCGVWLYRSGFPKSMDVSAAIDHAAGVERPVLATEQNFGASTAAAGKTAYGDYAGSWQVTSPVTDAAVQWQGWGTALKPAIEPWVLARKPTEGTTVENVQAYGTGALNIDACRSAMTEDDQVSEAVAGGRWPANVITGEDDDDLRFFRYAGGQIADYPKASAGEKPWPETSGRQTYGEFADEAGQPRAADGALHPTVKPVALMRHLVTLVTPPGGTVLDPFAGSGTTGEAAIIDGFDAVLIEREDGYLPLIKTRLDVVPSELLK